MAHHKCDTCWGRGLVGWLWWARQCAACGGDGVLKPPAVIEIPHTLPPLRTEEVERAIATIEDSRSTHVYWLEYFRRDPQAARTHTGDVGDAAHHQQCIEGYDQVLSVLQAALGRRPELKVVVPPPPPPKQRA